MLPILKQRGIRAQLLLIGDSAKSEDRHKLEQLASDLQVADQVTITGFLPRRDALNLARTADIGVSPFFPSKVLDVASPTKLIEYLALGLPVVANAHPDQSAVLKACRSGVCVPWGARHFARAITWLSHRSDAELTAMGRRGRDWVLATRSYERIADAFEVGCNKAAQSRRGE
jgi:glycosyltransferase involved in cell wall biosynthesis